MQNIEALCGEILALGAQKAGGIAVGEIPFHAELRRACEQNFCGAYGKNYMCPPHCGDVETLIERARTYRSMILFQRVYPTEDSFDIESMQAAADARPVLDHGALRARKVSGALCAFSRGALMPRAQL